LLIEELFDQQLEEIVRLLRRRRRDPDPWHALTDFLERVLELQAKDRAHEETLVGAPGAPERIQKRRSTLHPLAAEAGPVASLPGHRAAGLARPTGRESATARALEAVQMVAWSGPIGLISWK
jgi:hypothetical protein